MITREIQDILDLLGYRLTNDGWDGPLTKEAVKAFQRDAGLEADGVFGHDSEQKARTWVATGMMRPAQNVAAVTEKPEKNVAGNHPAWWKDIKWFTPDEPYIACSCGKCGGFPVEPTEKLMRLADKVRTAANAPMTPTSTVRCPQHNSNVGGVYNSRHLLGTAMDFHIRGWSATKILALVKSMPEVAYAYSIDEENVHMDVVL